jgi:hypothetical protein
MSEEVIAVGDVGDPIAHRFVDRVLERAGAGVDAADRRAEQVHAEDIQRLALHVVRTHVDVALEAEQRADSRGCDTVLPRAGFGDHPALPHPLGEQGLPECVVDLVGARMCEILAFEENPGAAKRGGQPLRFIQRRGPANVVTQQLIQRGPKRLVGPCRQVRALQFLDRSDEGFRHEPAAECPVVPARVGIALSE